MDLIREKYRKLKKIIAVKTGKSKPDSMTEAKIVRSNNKPVIWLLGTEDYGNLGDHKIAIAIWHFLEYYFKDYDVIELSARNYFNCCSKMEEVIREEDIIVGTGGGNFGNQYPGSQKIRMDYISRFPNNKIIIMPQTIWYTQDDEGAKQLEADIKLCGMHPRLLLAVREKKSKKFAEEHFKNPVILVPDMVLFEKPYHSKKEKGKEKKVVFCLRSDLEGVLDKTERKKIMKTVGSCFKIKRSLDTQKDYLISTGNREDEVNQVLEEMSSADLVVTDRLHGMIFAALAETPCIAFDNYNGKVQGIYEWIEDLSYICYKGMDTDIEQDVQRMLGEKGLYAPKKTTEKFNEFAEVIRSF